MICQLVHQLRLLLCRHSLPRGHSDCAQMVTLLLFCFRPYIIAGHPESHLGELSSLFTVHCSPVCYRDSVLVFFTASPLSRSLFLIFPTNFLVCIHKAPLDTKIIKSECSFGHFSASLPWTPGLLDFEFLDFHFNFPQTVRPNAF